MSLLKNLNGPTADNTTSQSDYLTKERQAAEELLRIQSKNAEQLNNLKIKLLRKLQDEAIDQGTATEEYLAQYGLQERLKTIKTTANAEIQAKSGNFKELNKLQQKNDKRLKVAETKVQQQRAKQQQAELNTKKKQLSALHAEEVALMQRRSQLETKLQTTIAAELASLTATQLQEIEIAAKNGLNAIADQPVEITTTSDAVGSEKLTTEAEATVSIDDKALSDVEATAVVTEIVLPEDRPKVDLVAEIKTLVLADDAETKLESELADKELGLRAVVAPEIEPIGDLQTNAVVTPEVEPITDLRAVVAVEPEIEPLDELRATAKVTAEFDEPLATISTKALADVEVTSMPDLHATLKATVETEPITSLTAAIKAVPEIAPIDDLKVVAKVTAEIPPVEPLATTLELTPVVEPIEDLNVTGIVKPILETNLSDVIGSTEAEVLVKPAVAADSLKDLTADIALQPVIAPIDPIESTISLTPIIDTAPIADISRLKIEAEVDTSSQSSVESKLQELRKQTLETALRLEREISDYRLSSESSIIQTRLSSLDNIAVREQDLRAISETPTVRAVEEHITTIVDTPAPNAAEHLAEVNTSQPAAASTESTSMTDKDAQSAETGEIVNSHALKMKMLQERTEYEHKTQEQLQLEWLKNYQARKKSEVDAADELLAKKLAQENEILLAQGFTVEQLTKSHDEFIAFAESEKQKELAKLSAESEEYKAGLEAAIEAATEAARANSPDSIIDFEKIKAEATASYEAEADLRRLDVEQHYADLAAKEEQLAEARKAARKKVNVDEAKESAASRLKDQSKKKNEPGKRGNTASSGFLGQTKELGKSIANLASYMSKNTDAVQALMEEGYTKEEAEEAAYAAKSEAAQEAYNEAMGKMGNYIEELAKAGDAVASKQTAVDTRLQGLSTKEKDGGVKKTLGSYWRTLESAVTKGIAVSPFLTQQAGFDSIEKLAKKGIGFNIKERAFLDTVSTKIADTFEVTEDSMLQLIRIQQADTTAARLGMESALTEFLNSMYATSEYMSAAADSVRQSLMATTSLMDAEEATEFEYQVQKWMGSLHSVGFTKVDSLAETLGKLASGDISSVTDNGMGNLLIMAANEAAIPIAQILEKGLTSKETNELLKHTVKYLAGIHESTKSSRVLAQQFADVYGVTATDLRAAANLATSIDTVAKTNETHGTMLQQLHDMANSMYKRVSTGEMFSNVLENFKTTFAATLANNPVLSGLHNIANMLNDLVGGIELPFVNVMGFGFDLNATVADLMNVGALSGAVLGGIGKLVAGLASGGGFSGSGMLKAFGVASGGGGADIISRGNVAGSVSTGGSTTSESGSMAGNSDGEDVKNKTLSDASEEPSSTVAEAKEDEEEKEEARTQAVISQIVNIYDLLLDVTMGAKKFHVQLELGHAPLTWQSASWYG